MKLAASELCQPSLWQDDADTSAAQYNDVITRILDQVIPARAAAHDQVILGSTLTVEPPSVLLAAWSVPPGQRRAVLLR